MTLMDFFAPSSASAAESRFFVASNCVVGVIERCFDCEKGIDLGQVRYAAFEVGGFGCLCRLCNGGHEEG